MVTDPALFTGRLIPTGRADYLLNSIFKLEINGLSRLFDYLMMTREEENSSFENDA